MAPEECRLSSLRNAKSSTNTSLSGAFGWSQGPNLPLRRYKVPGDLSLLVVKGVLKSPSRRGRITSVISHNGRKVWWTCYDCEAPSIEFPHLKRCGPCNRRMLQARRRRKWRRAITSARSASPKGFRKVFLVTLTRAHDPIPRHEETWGPMIAGPFPSPKTQKEFDERTRSVKDCFMKLQRTSAWKRHFLGTVWGLEVVTRPDSILRPLVRFREVESGAGGDPLPTSAPGEDSNLGLVRTWTSELVWTHHPHIHVVAVGRRWDLDELDTLAKKYGFRTNIKEVRPRGGGIAKAINYVTKYATKENRPGERSNNTTGCVRKMAQLQEARRRARLQAKYGKDA